MCTLLIYHIGVLLNQLNLKDVIGVECLKNTVGVAKRIVNFVKKGISVIKKMFTYVYYCYTYVKETVILYTIEALEIMSSLQIELTTQPHSSR